MIAAIALDERERLAGHFDDLCDVRFARDPRAGGRAHRRKTLFEAIERARRAHHVLHLHHQPFVARLTARTTRFHRGEFLADIVLAHQAARAHAVGAGKSFVIPSQPPPMP